MTDLYDIFVECLRLQVEIGIHSHEIGRTQEVEIDLSIRVAPRLRETGGYIDYEAVIAIIRRQCDRPHRLQEDLASAIVTDIMAIEGVDGVSIKLGKTTAFPDARRVGVVLRRGNTP